MEEKIKALREAMEQAIAGVDTKEKLAAFWQDFLGKKGSIAEEPWRRKTGLPWVRSSTNSRYR